MSDMNITGDQLRRIRRERTMTQEDLAREAGVAVSTIVGIERGQFEPRVSTIRKLSTALQVEPRQLLGGESPAEQPTEVVELADPSYIGVREQALREDLGEEIRDYTRLYRASLEANNRVGADMHRGRLAATIAAYAEAGGSFDAVRSAILEALTIAEGGRSGEH
jgi:transcriptional regulator with XRE-family HTH domain